MGRSLRVVCISDTHNRHKKVEVPDGDLLIHAGDLTSKGRLSSIKQVDKWLGKLPHEHKIIIAGNHDFGFQQEPEEARSLITNAIYLEDEEVAIEGLRIYGSPWQPWFFNWAFNLHRGEEIREKWDLIPEGIDILVTHGPPWGHNDRTSRGEIVGCQDLLDAVHRVKPKYHIFGHIHEDHGISEDGVTTFINASICTLEYKPTQSPIVFEIEVPS